MTAAETGEVPVRCIAVVPREGLSERGARLLRLALSLGWACGSPMGAGRGLAARPARVLVPEEWASGGCSGGRAYGDTVDLGGGRGGAPGGWAAVLNGRYAIEVDQALIDGLTSASSAGIISVTVIEERGAYRERLRAVADGTVLGFRRLYSDTLAPAPMPDAWPHMLLIREDVLRGVGADGAPAAFGGFAERAKALGVSPLSFEVGGRACDLATDDGVLCYLSRACHGAGRAGHDGIAETAQIAPGARVFGGVIVGSGARVGEGAIVIGPSLVGEGAAVGGGALVRGSVIAPGAVVGEGETACREVVLAGDGPRAGGLGRLSGWGAPGTNYRRWPVLSYARTGKRAFDVAFSLFAFVLLATIFPLVAIAIKVTSKGPIFYCQRRQGRHGREFRCLKFRTMVQGAEAVQNELREVNEVDGPQFKMENDPRVTLVGEFLRATNLDEIPQFINVLRGDMSIVGPRPSPDSENQMCPSWREARLSVRPGITGLWQVSRSRERKSDFQEWIHYDVLYVRRLSLWLDLAIVARTVGVLAAAIGNLFATRSGARDAAIAGAGTAGLAGIQDKERQ